MKNKHLILISLLSMIVSLSSCSQKNVKEWTSSQIDNWLQRSTWVSQSKWTTDTSIDKRQFVEQNVLNPTAWQAAYEFLTNVDFDTLSLGKYELLSDGTFATVSDYITKDSAQFEAHKKYIDIQYVHRGKEYILKSTLENTTPCKEYNAENDIEFFSTDVYTTLLADSTQIIVLFPSDGHKPCMSVDEKMPVRKIVVKIPFIE